MLQGSESLRYADERGVRPPPAAAVTIMQIPHVLERLTQAPGAPGSEGPVVALVKELFLPYCDEVKVDPLGNLIARRAARRKDGEAAPAVMLATHVDEIAMMVRDIDENGFLRVIPLGGVDLRYIQAQEVVVHGSQDLPGVTGTAPEDDHSRAPRWEDVWVDVGLGAEAVRALVTAGDRVTFHPSWRILHGDRVASKALDNRASVAALWDALRRLAVLSHSVDVIAVATVQEEVGLRGALVSTFGTVPQAGIAIDVGFGAMPGIPKHESLELRQGPGITLGANVHPGIRQRLLAVAREQNVPFQVEVAPASSGTDAWAMQISRSGVPTAVVSLPLRYMHSPVECVDLNDIKETARLVAAFLADLQPAEVWGWSHGTP